MTDWWREAVFYQVYLRSFADSDGDGQGDIDGIASRLPYLRDLGIEAIWVNPWYVSPLADGGYDVADYRDIDPRFGTLDDAERFIAAAGDHGIRVLVDLVPNHTSSEHPWFREALASPSGSPARARYHFRPGRGEDGELPPTDWPSRFGGSAWTRVGDGEWYLHLFDRTQPDLDWTNPDVADEFEDIMRFWLDRGAAGFRVDVAHGMVKDPGFPDLGERPSNAHGAQVDDHPYWDRDGIHDIVRRWRRLVDRYDGAILVAEAWVQPDRRPLYLRPDEYHQAFDFDLTEAPWDAAVFGSVCAGSIAATAAIGGSPTWTLSNHDVVRHATRYGLPPDVDLHAWLAGRAPADLDIERGRRRARAAALLVFSLPGAAYVYQGDELALPEVWELPEDVLQDPIWEASGRTVRGRDGCRVPIPWTSDGPSYGFGPDGTWLPQPASFGTLAVAVQEGDPDSTLELYRRAIATRRDVFGGDPHREVQVDGGRLEVGRANGATCIVNMGERPLDLPAGRIVLASGPLADDCLPPDTAVWLAVSS